MPWAKCPTCGDTRSPEMTQWIGADDSSFADLQLKQLGIPLADLILVEFAEEVIPFRGNEATFAAAESVADQKLAGQS